MKNYFRNIFKRGHTSLGVVIPKDITGKLKIKDTDRMEVWESRGIIRIRKAVK